MRARVLLPVLLGVVLVGGCSVAVPGTPTADPAVAAESTSLPTSLPTTSTDDPSADPSVPDTGQAGAGATDVAGVVDCLRAALPDATVTTSDEAPPAGTGAALVAIRRPDLDKKVNLVTAALFPDAASAGDFVPGVRAFVSATGGTVEQDGNWVVFAVFAGDDAALGAAKTCVVG